MSKHNKQQKDECFQDHNFQELESNYLHGQLNIDLHVNVSKQLPPNELRNIARPQKMVARTLAVNKCMTLLPKELNQPCIEAHEQSKQGSTRIRIANKQKLPMQQYFSRKQYKQVYNRLAHFPSQSKNFTGKLLSIDSVADYNHKMFRQLQYSSKQLSCIKQDTIDADFQSGNLCRAFTPIAEPMEYYLMIENDINTYGYNIWFFFRFRNLAKGVRTFSLVNMVKKTEMYKKGMQVSVFSKKRHEKESKGWVKTGDRICFGQTNFARLCHLTQRYYYLSFQYDFQYDNDQVYFAMNQPYTYTRMIKHISIIEQKPSKGNLKIQLKKLGHTLADNIIPGLKIYRQTSQHKETILVTARQHPCETVSSFVCEGMIDKVLSGVPEVEMLLEKYVLFVVPMVNPDGVVHGSSRCNLAGLDLNRQWSEFLIKEFTPETYRIKKYLQQLHKQNPIKYFIDLHGHGKKLNSFFFSCKKGESPETRLLQLVMNKLQPRFNIMDCTYGIDRDKENTVRSQLYQLGITNCLTLECSLMGYVTEQGEVRQFGEQDLRHIGESVWKGIFALDNAREDDMIKKVLGFSKEELFESSLVVLAKISEKEKADNKAQMDDNASDSDPEGDILDINERLQNCCKNNMGLKKKIAQNLKKQKTRKKKTMKLQLKKEQRKNSSNSQTDSLQKVLTAVKLDNIQENQKVQKQISLQQQKRTMNKLAVTNKRTTIYSKKRKQRRQLLEKQPLFTQHQSQRKNSVPRDTSTEMKFRNHRLKSEMLKKESSKTSCSIIYEYPHEGMLSGKRKMSYRMRTEGGERLREGRDVPGVVYHDEDAGKGEKIEGLRETSLKALLTDTFSVLKIKPKLSVKRYVKVNPYQRQKKPMKGAPQSQSPTKQPPSQQPTLRPQTVTKKPLIKSQNRLKTFSHMQQTNYSQRTTQHNKPFPKPSQNQFQKTSYNNFTSSFKQSAADFKYKRFQSFLFNGITTVNSEKNNSSVFYYFPVL